MRNWRTFLTSLVLAMAGIAPASAAITLTASISAQTSGVGILSLAFTAHAKGGTAPYRYEWDFDARDGWQVEKTVSDPTWLLAPGERPSITLKVIDRVGKTTTVHYTPPAATSLTPYAPSDPITLRDVHGTSAAPVVISGKDIADAAGNGITLVNCTYIQITGNHIHGAQAALESPSLGNAIYAEGSSHIQIDHNLIEGNLRGVAAQSAWHAGKILDIDMHDNIVVGSRADDGLLVRGAKGVYVANNVLRNNGDVAVFDRHRISGIEVWDSDEIRIHDNFSTGSSSDGIAVASSNEVMAAEPGSACHDVEVFRNSSIRNGEQGIWLSVIHGGSAHDNYTYHNWNVAPELGSSGIRLESDVSNFSVYNNRVVDDEAGGIDLQLSQDVEIHDNYVNTPHASGIQVRDEVTSNLAGVPSRGISIHNNIVVGSAYGILIKGSSGTKVMNNTVYGSLADGIQVTAAAKQSIIANNISSLSRASDLNIADTSATVITNTIGSSVGFRGASYGDFALMNTSRARASGTPKYSTCLNQSNGKPDRGAVCARR